MQLRGAQRSEKSGLRIRFSEWEWTVSLGQDQSGTAGEVRLLRNHLFNYYSLVYLTNSTERQFHFL